MERLALSVFVGLASALLSAHALCPAKCQCFHTTVRCMFLQLDAVPQVPSHTTILDLRFNKIKDIKPQAFSHLKQLNTLLLNNNQITRLQNGVFDGLSELRYLYLYKNRIQTIENGVFKGLGKLEQLYLHFNKIAKLDDGVFHGLQQLERLFLHNNKLEHISSNVLKNMEVLKRLRLDSNALVCDCEMLWLAALLKEKQEQTQTAATCQFPISMRGKSLAQMGPNDLHCIAPRLLEEPQDVEVSFGGTAAFNCKAEGSPSPHIVWMRDSNEIDMGDPRYSVNADGTLIITPMSDSDIGVYECMAKSPIGESKSRSAKMIYNKQSVRPQFGRRPEDTTSVEGETVRLLCTASGLPKPEITWTRDDLPITPSNRMQISEDSLTILNLQREDTGQYKCIATNFLGRIHTEVQLNVNVAPKFTITPENLSVKSGELVKLICQADGSPTPVIAWYKDGNSVTPNARVSFQDDGSTITILHAKESDSGLYTCLAQNTAGSAETSAEIRVRGFGPRPPRLVLRPFPISAPIGASVELPCKAEGDPRPTITWTKDGEPLSLHSNHKVFAVGSLRLYNISVDNAGLYQCKAANLNGEVSAQGALTVEGGALGDKFVRLAFQEASAEVDRAVNTTVAALFHSPASSPSPHGLMRLLRFPDAQARTLARAADVYERTLDNVRKHVTAGLKVNSTQDFDYKAILSRSQLELVARLSGCMEHQPSVNCSDLCFHSKYRTIDGTCNNLQHPHWGASLTGFRRILRPIYENGFSTPVGWTKGVKYFGFEKPSARLVSTSLIGTDNITPDSEITHMVMQWGQFLDHDLDHAIPSTSQESWEGIDCKKSCAYAAPCFPMEVPHGDPRVKTRRCIDFIRSSAICGSGMTSVFFENVQPREQINQLTSFIDATQVYGFTLDRARRLRDLTNDYGLLRIGITTTQGKSMLPTSGAQEMDCRRDPTESDVGCFFAGDIRANEQVGLLAIHTIWLREHNRIATELHRVNPHWDGETLFQEARKIVGAEMQHITYAYWMRHVIGKSGMEMLGSYKGYDPNLDPRISNVFATAALRFGHSLINPVLARLDHHFKTIPEGDLTLGNAFFSPWRLVEEGGVDPLMRGLFTVAAKRKLPQSNLNKELTEHLFTVAHAVSLDLAAMNIQRSRDHAIPGYNDWRRICNLTIVETFDDLANEISDAAVRQKLRELYGHPGNIDVWVGGILEDQIEDARVGPLFRCLLVEQFRRIRDADRFWYESGSTFKPEQLTQVKQTSLARVLCDNGDNITRVTSDVFILPELQQDLLDCDMIPYVDLRLWYDCSEDCEGDIRPRRRAEVGNVTEERLEGLEHIVQELQRSIKQLRRKVKQLSITNHCRDSGNRLRRLGETWQKDICTHCVCQGSQVTCTTLQCAQLQCARQVRSENECCPVCA